MKTRLLKVVRNSRKERVGYVMELTPEVWQDVLDLRKANKESASQQAEPTWHLRTTDHASQRPVFITAEFSPHTIFLGAPPLNVPSFPFYLLENYWLRFERKGNTACS